LARRAENFREVCDNAVRWVWHKGVTVGRIMAAVAVGTPDLTDGERAVLATYCTYLNQQQLADSNAYVWPSNRLIALQLGCSENAVRDRRRALERKGYIVRDYNRANRPAGERAIDLSPLCARLDELEARRNAALAANAALREAWQQHVVDLRDYHAQAPDPRRLKQSQSIESVSVDRAAAPAARSRLAERRASPADAHQAPVPTPHRTASPADSANGFPRKARVSGRGRDPAAPLAEMLRAELRMAVQVVPALCPAVPPEVIGDPSSAGAGVVRELERIALELLPEEGRNNDETGRWGWSRHGVRTVAMLAVALGDPRVQNPCRYFGRLACSDPGPSLDLRLNLARILRERDLPMVETAAGEGGLQTPTLAAPGADDPCWLAIAAVLRQQLREGPFGAWFSQVGFHGLTDGVLSISAPPTAAARIRDNYRTAVIEAAAEAGFAIDRLVIIPRQRGSR
jgi:hypothetical protein